MIPTTDEIIKTLCTEDFIKKVLSVYTHSMTTIYLSVSAQVAKSTFFMKSPVCIYYNLYLIFINKTNTRSTMLVSR